MDLNILGELRFNDFSHKIFFLHYMFVTSAKQLEKHEGCDFLVYADRKVSIYHEEKDSSKRKRIVTKLKGEELDLEYGIQKSFIIYFEKIDIDRETLFIAASNLCIRYIQEEADKSDNIDCVCAVSHFDQRNQCPHLHVFYQCRRNIENELPSAVCRRLRG